MSLRALEYALKLYRKFERAGSRPYKAPELVQMTRLNQPEADLWAIGVIAYRLLCRRFPFAHGLKDKDVIHERIINEQLSFPPKSQIGHEAKDFICRLLDRNHEARMTMEQALEHLWLQGVADEPSPIEQYLDSQLSCTYYDGWDSAKAVNLQDV